MTGAQRRYLRNEAAIAAAINAVLSIGFVLVAFGGRQSVSTPELVRDAAMQSFFVTMFTVLVPGLLTRRRISAGIVAPLATGASRPWPILARAIGLGGSAALLAVAFHALLLPRFNADWRMPGLLFWKAVYGAALGAAVSWITLPAEMRMPSDRARRDG